MEQESTRIRQGAHRLIVGSSNQSHDISACDSRLDRSLARRAFWIIQKKRKEKKERDESHSRVHTRVQSLSHESRVTTYLSRQTYGVNWLLLRTLARSLACRIRFPPAVQHECNNWLAQSADESRGIGLKRESLHAFLRKYFTLLS